MSNLFVLIKKEFLELTRTKKLMILSIIFLFVAVTSPITAKLMPLIFKSLDLSGITIVIPTPTFMDSVDQFIKNISQLATFIIIFVAAGAIVEEKTNKTLEIVLTKPISRSNFIIAKFLAYLTSISAIFGVASLFFYFYTVTTFTTFSLVNFSIVATLVLLNILMLVSVTLYASTISRSTIAAAGLGLFFAIIVMPAVGLIKALTDYSPNFIYGEYKDIIMNGITTSAIKPIFITLTIIVFALISSIASFRKQEIER